MGARERERPADAGELAWTVWPARRRPLAAAVLLAGAVVLGVLIGRSTGDAVLAIAAPGFVLASLSAFFLPSAYRLTEEELEVRAGGVVRRRPWDEVRRMDVDATGVFLSPFERRHWLDAYRGARLLFGGNRDQVVAFVEARLRRPAGGAKGPAGAAGRAAPDTRG